jgi:hypothetical protein
MKEKTMETKKAMNVYEKLQLSRIKLQVMNIKKTGTNKCSKFGFTYYELTDFIPSINLIFGELKLHSIFSINQENIATLTIVNTENTDEKIVYSSPTADVDLRGGSSPIQKIGAIHTYMKRYLYMNALEIVENDIVDAQIKSSEYENTKEIENIKNINELNDTYKRMESMKHSDTSWKTRLKAKSDAMGAVFNKDSRIFEIPESA